MWIQICHKPFNDGTNRHPLLEVEIPDQFKVKIIQIMNECLCESDNNFTYYEVFPSNLDPEVKPLWQEIFKELGIKDSLYVEYFIKEKS
jgi:hypothetical protein